MIDLQAFAKYKEEYKATLSNPDLMTEEELEDRAMKFFLMNNIVPELEESNGKTFKDIIGHKDQKTMLLDIADYWQFKTKFSKPKGILLYGYPGCGKTALVNALANEVNKDEVFFKEIRISDVTGYVGTTEPKIRDLFESIRVQAAGRYMLLLMDEADHMIPAKSNGKLNDIVGERVSSFLKEVDGYDRSDSNTAFILTTNHPRSIEDAFLRAGRVGFKVPVEVPTSEERKELAKMYLGHVLDDKKIDIVFNYTTKWTGADYEQFSSIIEMHIKRELKVNPNYILTAQEIAEKVAFVIKYTKRNFKKFEDEYESYRDELE